MLKHRGFFKRLLALLLCVFLLVSVSACPPPAPDVPLKPEEPLPPVPPATAFLEIVPMGVRGGPGITTPAVRVIGAGFTPQAFITLVFPGNWTGHGGLRMTDPVIFATTATAFGAFNVSIGSAAMTGIVRVFNLTPGIYTILALEGVDLHVRASTPLQIFP
jgi:hypothetical protein